MPEEDFGLEAGQAASHGYHQWTSVLGIKGLTREKSLNWKGCKLRVLDYLYIHLFPESIKILMGPEPNGPLSVSCARAIRYSGLGSVQWVLLEISWTEGLSCLCFNFFNS